MIRKKDTPLTIRHRCQIILDLDKNHRKMLTYAQCYKSNGVYHATISNTVAGFAEHGMDYLASLMRNENSANARRKADGRAAARIIEIACSIFAFIESLGGNHHVSVREHRAATD